MATSVASIPSEKILYLESLRGLAALTVAIFHFNIGSSLNNGFTNNGWLMVDFFFVLSGFVIALNYQHRMSSFADVYQFQIRRFLRLYPLHLATLLLFLALEVVKLIGESVGLESTQKAFTTNDLSSFIANLLLVQSFDDTAMVWNSPSWSISAEFYTYILFAVCTLFLAAKPKLFQAFCVLITILAAALLLKNGMSPFGGMGLVRCIYSFFLGVMCFNITRLINARLPSAVSYLGLIATVLTVVFAGDYKDPTSVFIPLVFVALIFSLVMSEPDNWIQRILNIRPLVYLGTISYGIYMIHAALWWVYTQLAKALFSVPTQAGVKGWNQLAFDSLFTANCVMLLGLSGLILLSHWSYQYLERPMNNLRYKLAKFE